MIGVMTPSVAVMERMAMSMPPSVGILAWICAQHQIFYSVSDVRDLGITYVRGWYEGSKLGGKQDNGYSHSIYDNGTASIPCSKFFWSLAPALRPSTTPCGHDKSPIKDVENINKQLNKMGDSKLCCSDGSGGCINIADSGSHAVDLCATATTKLCVGCAQLWELCFWHDQCVPEGWDGW